MMHHITDPSLIDHIGQKIVQSEVTIEREATIKIYHQIGSSLANVYTTMPSPSVIKSIIVEIKKQHPSIQGISAHSLRTMYRFAKEYKVEEIELLHLGNIAWGHHLILLNTVRDQHARLFYIQAIIKYGWSRTTLIGHIQTHLYERHAKVVTNFSNTLSRSFAQYAQGFFKHTYFFSVTQIPTSERAFEDALLADITNFLKELGPGFAFIGRQYYIQATGDDCYIDLLLYNVNLKSYVIIELKQGVFKSEYVGKMHLYMQAVDTVLKNSSDNQTIGLILCKSSSPASIATLQDAGKPLVVGEYQIKLIKEKQEKRNLYKRDVKWTFFQSIYYLTVIIFIVTILLFYVPFPHGSRCSGSSSSSSSDSSSLQDSSSSSSKDNPSWSKL